MALLGMAAHGAPPATGPGPVFVVGIDSATWRVIDPLVAAGQLPTFQRLRDEGVSGELHTLVPTYSPTIWTTMVTGVVPVVHGIQTPPPPGEMPQTSDCRRVAAIWDMAGEHCLRSNVLNLWCTWPAEHIAGNLVTERTAWSLPGIVSPEPILPLVESLLPRTSGSHVQTLGHAPATREAGLVELAIALEAFDPADFTMLYFRELDVVQHRAWASWPPDGAPDGTARDGDVPAAYRRYDAFLARIEATLPPDATLIVVSDHGMECLDVRHSRTRLFDANVLLERMGLLVRDPEGHVEHDRSAAIAVRSAPGAPLAVQLTGRLPPDEVRDRLLAARIDGQPLFRLLRESRTQLVLQAPMSASDRFDAVVTEGGATLRLGELFSNGSQATGEHDNAPPGIIILHGAGAGARGLRIERASVLDVGPTILALLHLPPPAGCQGRVLEEALRPDVVESAHDLGPHHYNRPPPVPSRLPREVNRADEEQLRALGYIN